MKAARAVIRVAATDRYPVPGTDHRVEQVIRRSRFITTLSRTTSPQDAESLIDRIRGEFGDATHNCWAYVAGPPGSTTQVGMSDDGEPHGTAGRPMLEALVHSGVGEIGAVITRFYGGVKLGKGGLQRAYAGGVKLALSSLATIERVTRSPLVVRLEYPVLDPIRRLADDLDARVVDEKFTDTVRLQVDVPVSRLQEFRERVAEVTSGDADIDEG